MPALFFITKKWELKLSSFKRMQRHHKNGSKKLCNISSFLISYYAFVWRTKQNVSRYTLIIFLSSELLTIATGSLIHWVNIKNQISLFHDQIIQTSTVNWTELKWFIEKIQFIYVPKLLS